MSAAPPEFLQFKSPQLTRVPVGKDAVFHCSATSHNSYMKPPVWMVNSKPLLGRKDYSTLQIISYEVS